MPRPILPFPLSGGKWPRSHPPILQLQRCKVRAWHLQFCVTVSSACFSSRGKNRAFMFMSPIRMARQNSGSRLVFIWQSRLGSTRVKSAKRSRLLKLTSEQSQMRGIVISTPEVTHVSKHGFWLLLADEELLLPFEQFPWFRRATIEQMSNVEWPAPEHLYWPDLDIDLALESIRRPEAFPLVSRG